MMDDFYDTEKPDGMLFDDVPTGPQSAQSSGARSRATHITKAAVQYYLQKYFAENGPYRDQIRAVAPHAVNYETSYSGTFLHTPDPTKFNLQIARFWPSLKQKLPCIVILDSGYRSNSVGFGGTVAAYDFGGTQGFGLRLDATVGINIEIAAKDDTTCGDIRDAVALIFQSLTHFNREHIIQSTEATAAWEVRLPLSTELQQVERRAIPGSETDVVFTTMVTLQVDFEGVLMLATESPNIYARDGLLRSVPVTDIAAFESHAPSVTLDIHVPEVVYYGRRTPINAPVVPFGSKFVSDNPKVAIIQGDTIITKRLGKFNVILFNDRNEVISSYPVTVTTV